MPASRGCVRVGHRPALARRGEQGREVELASWAPSAANRSNTSSCTSCARWSGRSTLLITTIGQRPRRSALPSTNLVCGIGPSAASTSSSTPSTIERMRSTSPPKSAWPGVSTMLIRVSCQTTEVHLARIVMPRSRSRSLESIARSATCWLARKVPLCCSSRSTRVVLPWSTWAMMAMLRRSMDRDLGLDKQKRPTNRGRDALDMVSRLPADKWRAEPAGVSEHVHLRGTGDRDKRSTSGLPGTGAGGRSADC